MNDQELVLNLIIKIKWKQFHSTNFCLKQPFAVWHLMAILIKEKLP